MASIDPTGLDLTDPRAVRRKMAHLAETARLEACGVTQAEDEFFDAMERLLGRDPALYRETLLTHLRMFAADFIDSPCVPMLGKRRRWRALQRALKDQVRDSFGAAVVTRPPTRTEEE